MTASSANRVVSILGTLAFVACSEPTPAPPEPADTSLEVRDSAGVEMRIADARRVAATTWAHVDSQPRFELGRSDDADEVFFQVRGMTFLGTGDLVVLDGSSSELRRYDSEGRLLETIGREGEGPGEFGDPHLVPPGPSDSLWIWDSEARVLHRFDPDDWTVEVVRPQSWRGARAPLGITGSLLLTESTPVSGFQDGVNESVLTYRSFDLRDGSEADVAQFTLSRFYRAPIRPGGPPGISLIPFSEPPPAAIWGGSIAVAAGPGVEVALRDRGGGLNAIHRIDGWPVQEVTPTMIEAARRLEFGEVAEEPGVVELYEGMPIPDTLPGVDRLIVDREGRLWVGLYQTDPEAMKTWVAFERQGAPVGQVQTPAGFQLMAADASSVAGVARDDMDREIVQVFDLRPFQDP